MHLRRNVFPPSEQIVKTLHRTIAYQEEGNTVVVNAGDTTYLQECTVYD